MKKFRFVTLAACGVLFLASPAFAGTYKLNCVDSTTGQATTVTVEASSRSAAIDKVRNDPAYADYDQCQ